MVATTTTTTQLTALNCCTFFAHLEFEPDTTAVASLNQLLMGQGKFKRITK